jgi:hypothetical protein
VVLSTAVPERISFRARLDVDGGGMDLKQR